MPDGANPSVVESSLEHWYLAQLKPGGFDRAKVNLGRQQIDHFMPLRPSTSRRASRLKTKPQPLFPGYIFVEILPGHVSWRTVNSTYGISKLVTLERDRPTRVPPGLMSALFSRTAEGIWQSTKDEFQVGQEARVISGPFAGAVARIDQVSANDRIYVLLDLLGRATRVKLSTESLQPL